MIIETVLGAIVIVALIGLIVVAVHTKELPKVPDLHHRPDTP